MHTWIHLKTPVYTMLLFEISIDNEVVERICIYAHVDSLILVLSTWISKLKIINNMTADWVIEVSFAVIWHLL